MSAPRILLDLKPAFDGFAGIPQETRLLFQCLRRHGQWEVKGLIQHGARQLASGLRGPRAQAPTAHDVYRLSQLVVSLGERPRGRPAWQIARARFDRYIELQLLKARSALGIPVQPTVFDSRLFTDFVWRTLFDKTLNAQEKDAVAADDYYVVQAPRSDFQKVGLRARHPILDTRGFDFFVAQTPFPGRLTRGTQMVVRYHDAVPLLMPHTISNPAFHQATHYSALRSNIASGATFACISGATRNDLLTLFPELHDRTVVIYNMVSEEYFEDESPRGIVPRLIKNRLVDLEQFKHRDGALQPVGAGFDYLLMVSTIEPRKNHALLVAAWERLKYTTHPDLKLVIVGTIGWQAEGVLKAFKPWAESGDLFYLQNVPSAELRSLYKHASATICPSFAEGFDYSGVEAMRCGCPVASSDIPVHREIYRDASVYFNPYCAHDAAQALLRLVGPGSDGERLRLREVGKALSEQYMPARILPLWHEFFRAQAALRNQIPPTGTAPAL